MWSIIAKAGITPTTAKAVVYALVKYAGGGFIHCYTLQHKEKIQLFIKDWSTSTIISDILCCNFAWRQFQAGISNPILQDIQMLWPYFEYRWLKSLHDFLHKCTGKQVWMILPLLFLWNALNTFSLWTTFSNAVFLKWIKSKFWIFTDYIWTSFWSLNYLILNTKKNYHMCLNVGGQHSLIPCN